MPNVILAQTDVAADCGAVAGCSGATLVTTPQAREAKKDATPGVNELTVTVTKAAAAYAGVMFQSADGEPGEITWDAGNWVVRLNVTAAQESVTWVGTYVCRFDNACGSLATVGSLTGQSISLGTTGVKEMTVAGAEQSANLSDEIYIVLLFSNSSEHAAKSFGFTPDQNIDTPIVMAGATPKSVSDSGSGADSIGVKVKCDLSDSGTGADNLAALLAKLAIQDSGNGIDALVEIKAILALLDSGSGLDALTVKQFRDIADSGIGAEAIASKVAIGVIESGLGTDALSILSKLTVSELGVGADIISILARLLMEDSGVGVDDISVSEPTTPKEVQDSGTGQDALAVKAILNILDDALGADSLLVRQFRIVSESGVGVGALAIKNLLTLLDSGLGSEALSILSKVAVQDAGLAAGILAVLSKVSIQDLAAGIDEAMAKKVMERFVADEGIGADMVSALARTYYPIPFKVEPRDRSFDTEPRKRFFKPKGRDRK